jgi:transcription initiation factor TFIID subunit 11
MQSITSNSSTPTNANMNQKMVVVMSGITKVFIGELVETGILYTLIINNIFLARSIMEELNEVGPIRPKHISEAYCKLKEQNKIPYLQSLNTLFM